VNRFFISPKFLVAATLAAAALGTVTVAEAARPEVYVSVDFQSGPAWVEPSRGYYVESQPVYVQPQPVYVQPQPVYLQPQPMYVHPRPIYVQPAPVYVRPPIFASPREVFEQPPFGRYEWEREHAWRHAEWRRHERHAGFRSGWQDHDDDHDRGHRD
jgi:hypothetical protein